MSLKEKIKNHLINIPGWRTNQKLVVIESDDWGSIRMPNQKVYKAYSDLGYNLSSNPYCKNDTLSNSVDFEKLFSVLRRYRGGDGNYPIVTVNTVVANPNFQKIKKSEFINYYFEPFTTTLKRYYPKEDVFMLWNQGINDRLIQPQFHGREHVNVPIWLELLRKGNKPLRDAFDHGFWGIPKSFYAIQKNNNIQASYNSANEEHIEGYRKAVIEGLKLFENIFRFKSKTFIANNFIWPKVLGQDLAAMGIVGLQGMHYQKIPQENGALELYEIYTGKRNEYNQIYTMRNCAFEPAQTPLGFNDVVNCLSQIKTAFFWKKPAILAAHRLNFIGTLDEKNRRKNLKSFDTLLKEITKRWPEVRFISSDELVDLIINNTPDSYKNIL